MPVGIGEDILVQEFEDGLAEIGIWAEILDALKRGRDGVPALRGTDRCPQ